MENKVKIEKREEGKERLRDLIDLIKSFKQESKLYWIKALYTQGKIEASIAGRLLIKEGLI